MCPHIPFQLKYEDVLLDWKIPPWPLVTFSFCSFFLVSALLPVLIFFKYLKINYIESDILYFNAGIFCGHQVGLKAERGWNGVFDNIDYRKSRKIVI